MSDAPWSWKGHRPRTGLRAVFALRTPWARIDWHVLLLAAVLVGTGVVFVHALWQGDQIYGRHGGAFSSHVKKLVVAFPFLLLGFFVRPRWVRRQAWLIYAGAMVLLILVPLVGEERNYARRWIQLPLGFDIQPSELAKLGLIVALARVLYRTQVSRARDGVRVAGVALLPMMLVAAQPDLGTALTIVPVTLGMAWLAGAPGRSLLLVIAGGLLAGWLTWHFELVQGYQLKRLDTWAASFDDQQLIEGRNGAGFHAYHSRVVIGNGGPGGTGLGRGVANEAAHLPERDCDSIFAVVAEETGFVGGTALILVYLLLCVVLLFEAAAVRERFTRLVVGGVALYFAAHFFINVGVNLGLLPMTGLTLPLVSTGGSSLMVSFLALGLALGFCARNEPTLDRDAFAG
jgi:rod shape determining protein RodA